MEAIIWCSGRGVGLRGFLISLKPDERVDEELFQNEKKKIGRE